MGADMAYVAELFDTTGFAVFEIGNDYRPSFYISEQSRSLRPLSDSHSSTVKLVMQRKVGYASRD
jgi:hypothetical protein